MRVTLPQQKYVEEVFGLRDPELQRTRDRMVATKTEYMSVSSSEARILQFLIRLNGVRKIVEFGTLYGYSALAMAKALPTDGKVITLEKSPEHHAAAVATFANSTVGNKIEALCGDAQDLMPKLEPQGPFDMVFIDANKAGYVDYLNWAEKNVRRGGLIVGDNTFLFGAMWNETERKNVGEAQVQVMHEFNNRLADSAKYNSALIPTVEGLTVAQKL